MVVAPRRGVVFNLYVLLWLDIEDQRQGYREDLVKQSSVRVRLFRRRAIRQANTAEVVDVCQSMLYS